MANEEKIFGGPRFDLEEGLPSFLIENQHVKRGFWKLFTEALKAGSYSASARGTIGIFSGGEHFSKILKKFSKKIAKNALF